MVVPSDPPCWRGKYADTIHQQWHHKDAKGLLTWKLSTIAALLQSSPPASGLPHGWVLTTARVWTQLLQQVLASRTAGAGAEQPAPTSGCQASEPGSAGQVVQYDKQPRADLQCCRHCGTACWSVTVRIQVEPASLTLSDLWLVTLAASPVSQSADLKRRWRFVTGRVAPVPALVWPPD
jgi:hypothetical protein